MGVELIPYRDRLIRASANPRRQKIVGGLPWGADHYV